MSFLQCILLFILTVELMIFFIKDKFLFCYFYSFHEKKWGVYFMSIYRFCFSVFQWAECGEVLHIIPWFPPTSCHVFSRVLVNLTRIKQSLSMFE